MALDTSQSSQTLLKSFFSAPCPNCKKSIAVRQDGCLRTHGPTGAHCPGSGSDTRGARPTADIQSTPTDNTQSSAPSFDPSRFFCSPKGKILKRIPRGARDAVAVRNQSMLSSNPRSCMRNRQRCVLSRYAA